MVSSELIHPMPSNGFGSPVSPPDIFLENREVPSPSQFTDPSCSPPSMHSPLHYTSDVEKFDNLMKEEPRSPYYNAKMLSSMHQPQVVADQRNYQMHQNYLTVDDARHIQNNVSAQSFNMMPTKLEPRVQPEFSMNSVDQEFRELLNNPEFSKTLESLDETIQLTTPETVQSMFFLQGPGVQNYPHNQLQQVSANNGPQMHEQQQQQLQVQQSQDAFVPSLVPANSPFSDFSENVLCSPRSDAQVPSDSRIESRSPMQSFADIIDETAIKSEGTESEDQTLKPAFLLNKMLETIITETGIPHSPYEWSVADVRQYLERSAEEFSMKIPLPLNYISFDGPALLKMTPEQRAKFIDSEEIRSLCDLLLHFLGGEPVQLGPAAGQNVQVKVEMNTQVNMKQEKHDIPQPMLPLPVTEATGFQYKQTQRPQDYQQNFQQQYVNGHQHITPSDLGSFMHNTSQFNNLSNFSSLPQQQNHCINQVPNSTQQQIMQGTATLHISQPPAASIPLKQNSSVESQMANMLQPLMPAGSVSPPVPLLEGANGYLDDSGTDLSSLLQQHPQPKQHSAPPRQQQQQQQQQQTPSHHPTTIDQEDIMETDEEVEEEVVPASTTGSSGRTHIQLWQFLKELLANNKRYGSCIRWIDRQEGIFKIEDSVKVATLWGERKNRPQMNYDKLSRSIRQYYNKNIMKKTERSQRLVYQFCSPYGQ